MQFNKQLLKKKLLKEAVDLSLETFKSNILTFLMDLFLRGVGYLLCWCPMDTWKLRYADIC